jgi:hypothetical protein
MIVMFSARRLKPGAWEQFRRAWDPGASWPIGPSAAGADLADGVRQSGPHTY